MISDNAKRIILLVGEGFTEEEAVKIQDAIANAGVEGCIIWSAKPIKTIDKEVFKELIMFFARKFEGEAKGQI